MLLLLKCKFFPSPETQGERNNKLVVFLQSKPDASMNGTGQNTKKEEQTHLSYQLVALKTERALFTQVAEVRFQLYLGFFTLLGCSTKLNTVNMI